jgi:hypothetical protein
MSVKLFASVNDLRCYTGQTAVEVLRILDDICLDDVYLGPQYVPTHLIVTQAWLACDEVLKAACGQIEHVGKRNTH